MEQEGSQYLEVARESLQVAHKAGLLKKLFSLLPSHQSEQSEQPVDYREEALNALQDNAVETLAGLSLTVGEAAQILEPAFTLDDLDKVNSTWQRHWSGSASKVGIEDKERRTWWARLLAGEIQQPETFSLRTLAVMDTLSTKEAKLFTKLCVYVWNPQTPVLIIPTEISKHWKPMFSESSLLESAGLIRFDPIGGTDWGTAERSANAKMVRPPSLNMTYIDTVYVLTSPEDKPVRVRCGQLTLTGIGQEVYRLTTPSYQRAYRDEIVEEWQETYTIEFTMQSQ